MGQELAHKSTCPSVTCREHEVADLDGEFPFPCGLGTGVIVTLVLPVILRYLCFSRVEPATHPVHRVRLKHSEAVRIEKSNFAQSRLSDRRVVSP